MDRPKDDRTKDPMTLFGAAGPNKSGWDEVSRTFRGVASRFSNCSVSVDGAPAEPYTLRVTHVYRREDGEWKIVTATATTHRSIRAVPPRHRPSRRHRASKALHQNA